jgi:hypothetical protein
MTRKLGSLLTIVKTIERSGALNSQEVEQLTEAVDALIDIVDALYTARRGERLVYIERVLTDREYYE